MIVNPSSVTSNKRRGAFIVFEGVDRCGKTTQVALLVKHLMSLGLAAVAMNFPDRSTMVGDLINQYLQSKNDLDDRAIHLLFSANRWEAVPKLEQWLLHEGTTVVCDRYAYSGVAFSSAKPSLDQELAWCQACDVGLPAPDAVIFLDLAPDDAERRGGYVVESRVVSTTTGFEE
jgi:dTMP kinase